MNAPELITAPDEEVVAGNLLSYYQAIENASLGMLEAARTGDWDRVVKLEGGSVERGNASARRSAMPMRARSSRRSKGFVT